MANVLYAAMCPNDTVCHRIADNDFNSWQLWLCELQLREHLYMDLRIAALCTAKLYGLSPATALWFVCKDHHREQQGETIIHPHGLRGHIGCGATLQTISNYLTWF